MEEKKKLITSRTQWLEILRDVQATCKERKGCEGCPLYGCPGDLADAPEDWRLPEE